MSVWHTARFVRKGNYLHGSFIKQPVVDGYINSLNPGNLKDGLGKFPFSEVSVDSAVGCAREAADAWHRSSLENRMSCLHRFRDQLANSIEQLMAYLTRETGKPLWESHAEVLATIKRIDVTLEDGLPQLQGWPLTELTGGCEFHPRGVIGLLGTYSMPLFSPCAHIVPSLLAGNTLVFKPSKYTPAIGQLIAEMIDRSRFPRGVFNLVQGNGVKVGARLAAHPLVDAVHLDGALDTALEIKRMTLQQPWKRLVLNTCGRGTAIVLGDADFDKAAYEVATGAFLSTGQRRTSTARVIVTSDIADLFAQRLVQIMEGLQIGQGLQDGTFAGPLISEAARKKFLAYAAAVEQEGHDVLFRAGRLELEQGGFFVYPSLVRIRPELGRKTVPAERVVGPALELYVARDLAHAVELHNANRLALVTSLFTRNAALMQEARYLLRSGVLNFNCSTISLSARLPLDSEGGLPMGLYAVRSCTHSLAYLESSHPFDPNLVMPGIRWPAPLRTEETTVPSFQVSEEEELGDATVSDLLIPSDETTPTTSLNIAAIARGGRPHEDEITPPMGMAPLR